MISRGEIWWATLGPRTRSAPAIRRPVLVVQANAFNRSRLNTVIAVTLTSNLDRANDPGNVLLLTGETGLEKHSVANVTQVVTLDKSSLDRRVSLLPEHLMARVDDGLRAVLSLANEPRP